MGIRQDFGMSHFTGVVLKILRTHSHIFTAKVAGPKAMCHIGKKEVQDHIL